MTGTQINGKNYPGVHVLQMNQQLKGLLTIIRNRDQPRGEFIFYADRIIRLLIEEGLSYLPFKPKTVITPTGNEFQGIEFSSKICGVSLIRAGESMEAGLRQVCKRVRIGKILISKDDEGVPHFLYAKLPKDIKDRQVLLLDPVLATGASSIAATKLLIEHGVLEKNIIFLNVIAAPEGVEAYQKAFPNVKIVSVEIEEGLSPHGMSLPGIGDFGDRYFGTDDKEGELRTSIKM